MTSELTDLHGLSRDVGRAWGAWQRFVRDLAQRADPSSLAAHDPIEPWRQVAGKSTYDFLAEKAPSALDIPLRDGLRRWIYALTQARTGRDLLVDAVTEAAERSARLDVLVPRLVTWGEAWRGLVAAGTKTERRAFLAAAAERGPALASLARRRAERRVEVAARLGLSHPAALAFPAGGVTHAELEAAARALLARTDDVAAAVLREAHAKDDRAADPVDATDAIAVAIARDAPEGWPAQSVVRWLDETVGLFARGLRIELPALPDPVGGSTFMRALGAFGHALREAGPSPSLPFVVAHDPYSASAHRFARVFATLPATAPFQRRVLGNGARVADGQARTLTRTALLDARLAAARLLLTDDASRPDRGLFEELTTRVLGAPLPASLAGAWPAARDDEPSRFLGLLGAPSLARDLIDRFDEDWFRNPRAVRHLRALASAPARDDGDLREGKDVDAAVTAIARGFEEALG